MTKYRACGVSKGEEDYVWDDQTPEICTCEDLDGISEDGRIMLTMGAMQKLRRKEWEHKVGWDVDDLDREYGGTDVLPEDLQDYSQPMVLLGTDVKSL